MATGILIYQWRSHATAMRELLAQRAEASKPVARAAPVSVAARLETSIPTAVKLAAAGPATCIPAASGSALTLTGYATADLLRVPHPTVEAQLALPNVEPSHPAATENKLAASKAAVPSATVSVLAPASATASASQAASAPAFASQAAAVTASAPALTPALAKNGDSLRVDGVNIARRAGTTVLEFDLINSGKGARQGALWTEAVFRTLDGSIVPVTFPGEVDDEARAFRLTKRVHRRFELAAPDPAATLVSLKLHRQTIAKGSRPVSVSVDLDTGDMGSR